MAAAPTRSLAEAVSQISGEMRKNLDSSMKKTSDSFSSFLTNVQTWKATLSSTPAGKSLGSSSEKIIRNVSTLGRSVQAWQSDSGAAVSSSISGFVQDFSIMCGNVERNVRTLRSGGAGPINALSSTSTSAATSAASSMMSFPPSTRDILEGIASPRADEQAVPPSSLPQSPSPSALPSSSLSNVSSPFDDIAEQSPHPDHSSVNATSVFSIGYVGAPLMRPAESATLNGVEGAPTTAMLDGPAMGQGSSGAASALRLEDVRRSIGRALIVFKTIRSLGLWESSWENKMPWRNPRPAFLAKGLQWPQEKFSSVKARREYNKRARRRGRYLIGPTPGWSWFAADVVFLYFLINNRAGNFVL